MSRVRRTLDNGAPTGGQSFMDVQLCPIQGRNLQSVHTNVAPAIECRMKKTTASIISAFEGSLIYIFYLPLSSAIVASCTIEESVPHEKIAVSESVLMSLGIKTEAGSPHQLMKARISLLSSKSVPALKSLSLSVLPQTLNNFNDINMKMETLINAIKCSLDGRVLTKDTIIPLRLSSKPLYLNIDKLDTSHLLNLGRFESSQTLFQFASSVSSSSVELSVNSPIEQDNQTTIPKGLRTVGGLSHVKDVLRSLILNPLQHQSVYESLNLAPPKGILLYGPPGTGKTLLVSAISEELNCSFDFINTADVLAQGNIEATLCEIFRRAKANTKDKKGGVLFFDEIDILIPKRDEFASETERKTVSLFLTEMDGLQHKSKSHEPVLIVIGATNRINSIDDAARRAGRFECELEIPVPDAISRKEIMTIHLGSHPHNLSEADVEQISSKCHGFTGADLKYLIFEANRNVIDEYLKAPTEKQLILQKENIENIFHKIIPSSLKELYVEIPNVKYHQIAGYEHVKQQLVESVEWPIKYEILFKQIKLQPPKGILLYGPPGCSKTMLAKAVATESEMNFITVKSSELFSKWVGDSEKAMRSLFHKARQNSPCILFFDEIDAIGNNRDQGQQSGGDSVANRVLSQLLVEIDGVQAAKQVIVIGATNIPDAIDSALLRPGRLDRLIYVHLPDYLARKHIVTMNIKDVTLGSSWSNYSTLKMEYLNITQSHQKNKAIVQKNLPNNSRISLESTSLPKGAVMQNNNSTQSLLIHSLPPSSSADYPVIEEPISAGDAKMEEEEFNPMLTVFEEFNGNRHMICSEWFAMVTDRYTGAEIVNLVKESIMVAVRQCIQSNGFNGDASKVVMEVSHAVETLQLIHPRVTDKQIKYFDDFHSKNLRNNK